jgi:hypothetical protein
LLAVSALPAIVGVGGADYQQPAVFDAGYERAQLICATLLFAGGLVAFLGLRPAAGRRASRPPAPMSESKSDL